MGHVYDLYMNKKNLYNLRCVGDTALIAGSQEKLQFVLDRAVTESQKKGLLNINCEKTLCSTVYVKIITMPNVN